MDAGVFCKNAKTLPSAAETDPQPLEGPSTPAPPRKVHTALLGLYADPATYSDSKLPSATATAAGGGGDAWSSERNGRSAGARTRGLGLGGDGGLGPAEVMGVHAGLVLLNAFTGRARSSSSSSSSSSSCETSGAVTGCSRRRLAGERGEHACPEEDSRETSSLAGGPSGDEAHRPAGGDGGPKRTPAAVSRCNLPGRRAASTGLSTQAAVKRSTKRAKRTKRSRAQRRRLQLATYPSAPASPVQSRREAWWRT